jgi:hypothetical protein
MKKPAAARAAPAPSIQMKKGPAGSSRRQRRERESDRKLPPESTGPADGTAG